MFQRSLARLAAPIALLVLAAFFALIAEAQPPAVPTSTEAQAKELGNKQEFLQRQWKDFSKNLLIIAQKFEKSSRVEDQEKAKTLYKVLELAEKEGVENKFTLLVRTLAKQGDKEYTEFKGAEVQNDQLVKILDQILQMLMNDDDLARIQAEKKELEKFLKTLKGILDDQKIARAITEANKADKDQLSKEQKELANRTDNLAKQMSGQKGGDPKKGGGGEPKDDKGTPKPDGDNKKEGKGDDKQDTGDAKANDKDPKGGPMSPEGSDSKPKGGDMGMEGGDSKPKGGMGEGGDAKPKPMGEKKDPSPKPMNDDKSKDPADTKNKGDNKADAKPSKGEGGEGAGKPMPMDPKEGGEGGGKSGGMPPMGGGMPPMGGGMPPMGGGMPPPSAPGAEQVKKAVPDQDNAAENIEQKKTDPATKNQDEAIEKLKQAEEELKKKLKQLREEELERLLANLEARVSRMLAMQKEVKANTIALDNIAKKAEDKKLPKSEYQRSQQQSDREGDIISEADKTLNLLQTEGTAVAFPGVLEEVRKDMVRVKERLYGGIVNDDTQAIEQDIIDALTEMQEALKKAQQDLKNGGGGGGGGGGGPQDQKLLDEIAELKMIKTLQENVNKRTKRYGDKYKGEQADDPLVKGDLKDLSGKQEKIEQMVKDIVEGRNK